MKMSSDIFNQTGSSAGMKNNNNSKSNNSTKTNSNSIQNNSQNNDSCNYYHKDLSTFEKMKQQLDLRKLFLNKIGVNDEKEIFSGENFQQNLQFETTVATYVQKKQLENNRQKQYQNNSSSPFLESPEVQIINDFNKNKGSLDTNEERNIEVKYDPYNTLYYLRQDQLIPPLTSGESSPNPSDDEDTFKGNSSANSKGNKNLNTKIPPSTHLDDILYYMIDSNLLQMEKEPQVQRATKSDRSTSWKNCYELLFNNVNVHMSFTTLKKEMRDRFKTFIFIQIDKFRTLYYQGKYSFIVRFSEENNAQFVYFNYKKNQQQYRTVFGENLEVYKVNQNNLDFYYYQNTLPNSYNQSTKPKESSNNYWVPVVIRNLPINFDRANLNHFLQSINVLKSVQNIEEFIILNEKKHTMIVFSEMESALRTLLQIPIKFKDLIYVRANLHPYFTKQSWTNKNMKENPHYAFYKASQDNYYNNTYTDTPGYSDIQSDSALRNLQNSKICQYFQFKKSFLEDVLNLNKKYYQKKVGDKEDDLKKLSQRSTTPIYHHEKINQEIEHQERFVIQKSSLHSDDSPSPRKNITNSYLDNIPSTESFKKQKGSHQESSFNYQKQQTSDQKSKNYQKKQSSRVSDSYKEERYKTPSLDSKHSRSKERKYGSAQKQELDKIGGNQTTERHYKPYGSKTRRKNQYSKSRSSSRAGREYKKGQRHDDNYKNEKRRTPSPQSDQNERQKKNYKQDKYKNKSNESKNDENTSRNDGYQSVSDSEERKKSENIPNNQVNQDEELRKYFENQGKQENLQEQKNREYDDSDQVARTPQSDDWGLSNHNERSSRCSENRLNGNEDDDLLQLNIEEQINKQFMNMFDKKDNIEEDNHKSPKTKKSSGQKVKQIKEDDQDNKYHHREGKNLESRIQEEKQEVINVEIQIQQKLKEKINIQQDISQKTNSTEQTNKMELEVTQSQNEHNSSNQQKEDIQNKQEKVESLEKNESQIQQDEENNKDKIPNQQPSQVMQKQKSILKAIEQSDDDDDSSMLSNSRNSSPISSSGSIKSQSYKNRQNSNNERKGSPTHQNQRREQYQKNNKNYNKNFQNNYKYNYHNNYQNRYNNYNQNMGNSHYQGNYRNNYNSQIKGNNQLNRTRSRSNSNSCYNHKRPHELSNTASGLNNNQFNRFNNQNNNRKFYKRGNYHDNYHNQYNNQYGNQYNRHRSSSRTSRRSYSNHSSEKKSPSYYKKKSIQRSQSRSQTRNQDSRSKSRQAKCSKTPSFTKENVPVNQIENQQIQKPQDTTTVPSEPTILNQQNSKENRPSNQRQNSQSRSSSQRKQSESNKRQSVTDNNRSFKKIKKQSNSPSEQKNENKDDKSPSSEEGEYDENNLSTFHNHQYRQRDGYQRNYKGGNFYRKDNNNNNFKKNRPFNYNNNTNMYNDRRGQQRESFSPEKGKERRSSSQSPHSRSQKYNNKRENEGQGQGYKKNQRYDKSPSSPYTPPNQGNFYNENRLKYNNYQKGYHKYNNNNNNNQQNDDRFKYNSKYNNHINYNKQQKSRSRSRSPYKNMNSQKGSQQKYN